MIRSARKARDPTDAEVNAVIDLYPDGAPFPVIADLLGTTDERVRQILSIALSKAFSIAKARGLVSADCFD
jgi:hypothetical protein